MKARLHSSASSSSGSSPRLNPQPAVQRTRAMRARVRMRGGLAGVECAVTGGRDVDGPARPGPTRFSPALRAVSRSLSQSLNCARWLEKAEALPQGSEGQGFL